MATTKRRDAPRPKAEKAPMKSCAHCAHWVAPGGDAEAAERAGIVLRGQCYRFPTIVPALPEHRCGEWKGKS